MSAINGNLRLILAIGGFVVTIAGSAVGYGALKGDVKSNAEKIENVSQALQRASSDPDASAAGAALRGEIKVIHVQLDEVQQQLDRIEAKLDRNSSRQPD